MIANQQFVHCYYVFAIFLFYSNENYREMLATYKMCERFVEFYRVLCHFS